MKLSSAKLAPRIRELVKVVVRSQKEKKSAGRVVMNGTGFNAVISSGADIYPLMPSVTIGPTDENRIGNQIQDCTLKVTATISQAEDGLFTDLVRPALCRVWILSAKGYKDTNTVASAPNSTNVSTELLHYGVAGTDAVPWDGAIYKRGLRTNDDLFTVHLDKQFTILPNAPNNGAVAAHFQGGATKNFVTFEHTIKLPRLKYQVDAAQYPTNSAPFMLIGYCYPDGAAIDYVNMSLVGNVFSELRFTDA